MRNLEIKNNDCHAALAMTKSVQSGRSMIEMLGVLAIIGVLSVGGIAGYSKAMHRYRINKYIEQITLIVGNIRTFFAPQRNYAGLNKTILKKAKLVPDEMWDGNNIEDVFGLEVSIHSGCYYSCSDNKAFTVRTLGKVDDETFIDIASYDWSVVGCRIIGGYGMHSGFMEMPADLDSIITFREKLKSNSYGATEGMIFICDLDPKSTDGQTLLAY